MLNFHHGIIVLVLICFGSELGPYKLLTAVIKEGDVRLGAPQCFPDDTQR